MHPMSDDLLNVLTRFHREVVVPDIERIVDAKITPLREEMLANFDAVFRRLDRLESEYQALSAAVGRLEKRMTSIEEKIDKLALRSELEELRERVVALEQRIAELESQL
jgi:predicted  nucleic acid-binding Zn-ribbon protein